MNPSINITTVTDALAAMAEARAALARSTAPGDFQIAERIAVAEGRLRSEVRAVEPRADLRPAA